MQRPRTSAVVSEVEVEVEGLPVVRPRAAGAALASEVHWVCAPTVEGSGREVEKFGATTPELERMVAWLKERKVESVAMESTGVYWIAPHEVLEKHGLEVVLVNTRELARVPGWKKTDRVDCKWIQRLHSCGLLSGSFRPVEQICMLRTLVRDQGNGGGRLVAADAEELGPDERAGASGGQGDRWGDGNVHPAGDCERRARPPEAGPVSRSALQKEPGGNRRTIEWASAGGSPLQPGESLANVRCGAGAAGRL